MTNTKSEYVYIYALKRHDADSFFYVGQAVDPLARFNVHARGGAALRPVGMYDLEMHVLEKCKARIAFYREQFWMDHFLSLGCDLTNVDRLMRFHSVPYSADEVSDPEGDKLFFSRNVNVPLHGLGNFVDDGRKRKVLKSIRIEKKLDLEFLSKVDISRGTVMISRLVCRSCNTSVWDKTNVVVIGDDVQSMRVECPKCQNEVWGYDIDLGYG